ncbi:MAG: hypothetical protein L3J39_17930 [Verrucomicrobiales bacterium]|nr:hypothetical protein [Verrucomicrobiales bacterium]
MKSYQLGVLCWVSLLVSNLVTCVGATEQEGRSFFSPVIDFDGVIAGDEIERETQGEVRIPYAEMRRLWLALREKDVLPAEQASPISAVVVSAVYDLELADQQSLIRVDYRVEVFSDEWQIVPLIGGDISLESSDAGEGRIVRQDGVYALMIKGKGEYDLQLQLRAAGVRSWPGIKTGQADGGLKLRPAAATLSRLRVGGLSPGQSMRLLAGEGDEAVMATELADGLDFLLKGEGQPLTLILQSADAVKASAAMENAPIVESEWAIESQIFVAYEDGRLHYRSQIFAQADAGSGVSMDLLLPQQVAEVAVEGEDVVSWKLRAGRDGLRNLHVVWGNRDRLDRRLQLSYQLAQSPLSQNWVIRPPRLAAEENRAKHLLAIGTVQGLEWKGQGVSATVASRRLPKWLAQQVKGLEFVTAESSGDLQIEAKWLPVLETVQATVSQATFATRVVKDGSMLVEAEYHVQQTGALHWVVAIPALDQVLSCEVDGQAVKPVRRKEGELEFHLKAPVEESNDSSGTVVKFSYALQSSAFDPVSGQMIVELPQTELFIHRLDWQLDIPQIYEITALEGNVQLSAEGSKSGKKTPVGKQHLIRLQKELCRGERPAVELYYRRRGIEG